MGHYVDLMGGQIDLVVGTLGTAEPLFRDGADQGARSRLAEAVEELSEYSCDCRDPAEVLHRELDRTLCSCWHARCHRVADQFGGKRGPEARGFPRKDALGAGRTRRRHVKAFEQFPKSEFETWQVLVKNAHIKLER